MSSDKLSDIYTELGSNQIRIVHLQPGDYNSLLALEMSTISLDNTDGYEALSWQWGNLEKGDHVFHVSICSRPPQGEAEQRWHRMDIRPNLWYAMKRLRQPDKEVHLWIDFICIKQVDEGGDVNSEKSKQISLMTKIYSKAKKVLVWLGEPGQGMEKDFTLPNLEKAFKYIESIGDLDTMDHIANVDTNIAFKAGYDDLDSVFRLFRCGWFSRRWVVQEIAVAQSARLHCGPESISWEKFAHAVGLLESIGRDGSINRMLKKKPETRHVSEYAGNISALPAYRLVQNTYGLYQERSRDGGEGKHVWQRSLEQLVCFLAVFEASRPQDTIYAVLGIASDFKPKNDSYDQDSNSERKEFEVDYDQGVLRVYKRFIKQVVTNSGSLDILCRPWAPVHERTNDGKLQKIILPSWIPSITRKPFKRDKNGKMFRYNADPLVAAAISRLRFFTASGSNCRNNDERLLEIDDENDKPYITVQAFELCKISEAFDCATFGNIAASWLEAGGWTDESKPPPGALWRTLVANRTSQGTEPDPWYPRAFLSAVREKGIEYGINTNQFIHEKDSTAYFEVFRRVQEVVWNRRLIKTCGTERIFQAAFPFVDANSFVLAAEGVPKNVTPMPDATTWPLNGSASADMDLSVALDERQLPVGLLHDDGYPRPNLGKN
ncbi:hypothetical protein FANTH_10167 [Fusarium anthophilum]|uniref:Heterokaryon incompatibility domain-containing protein n=1 Tax=Fusarium anthophilum TaxID=48485 RepID=A0A8H4Z2W1_9HYPO|nr:hypothetical protein FANTH_10167 [Fusarium anthophilum]